MLPIIYILLFIIDTVYTLVNIFTGNTNISLISFISVKSAFFIYFIVSLVTHNKFIDLMNKILSVFILIIIVRIVYYEFSVIFSTQYNPSIWNYIINILNIIMYVYVVSAICLTNIKKKRLFYLLLMTIIVIVNIVLAIYYNWNNGFANIIFSILSSIIPVLLDLIMVKYAFDFNTDLIKE